jgi:hypothetical protein
MKKLSIVVAELWVILVGKFTTPHKLCEATIQVWEDGRRMELAQAYACSVVGHGITDVEPLCYDIRVRMFHTMEMVFSQTPYFILFLVIMVAMMICLSDLICDSFIHFVTYINICMCV